MNIAKVLERVGVLKTGYTADEELLISYIDTAEMMVMNEIVRGREGDAAIMESFGGYDLNTPRETELFAPAPYDRVYETYAATQLDLLAEESERYINDLAVFRDVFTDLKRFWWQTHRQKRTYRFSEQ